MALRSLPQAITSAAPPTRSGATTATGAPPAAYLMIVLFGLAVGWVTSRYASGAREPREFLRPPRGLDRLAVILARRFGDDLLDEDDADRDDFERVAKNALAVAALMLTLLMLIGSSSHTIPPLITMALVVVAALEIGEALIAYGMADEPILTDPKSK